MPHNRSNRTYQRHAEFLKLANDLYTEGYVCGIGGPDTDLWFKAWAMAMEEVANGSEYTEQLVMDLFDKVKAEHMGTAIHEDSDGTGYCRGCGTTIGESHHVDCDMLEVRRLKADEV